ncbi:MAG: adenylyltransferase, partial [Deltaproteobacteria bacterium]|nr:adenylyltransferase [Deltaproteobacteria bacterium]
GQGPCYRCVFLKPPPPEAIPTCRQAGVIGAMAGVIGCLQALEAIKCLTGLGKPLTGFLVTFEALAMDFRKIKVPVRPNCPVCGPNPSIVKPEDYQIPACDLRSP